MPVQLMQADGGRIAEVRVSGKLTHDDYQHFVPAIEQLIGAHGKIRILFDMHDFHGWRVTAAWDDFKFGIEHLSDIERIAMVGDRKWQYGMSVFCRPFTAAQVRYFDHSAIDEAREWIAAQ